MARSHFSTNNRYSIAFRENNNKLDKDQQTNAAFTYSTICSIMQGYDSNVEGGLEKAHRMAKTRVYTGKTVMGCKNERSSITKCNVVVVIVQSTHKDVEHF